jgi:integrase
MAGTVRHQRLESRTARSGLKRGRQAHWQALIEGRVHLGYQRRKGEPAGRWLLRRYIGHGRYSVQALGRADDGADADGVTVLSYEQAQTKAKTMVALPTTEQGPLTVRQAWQRYVAAKRNEGRSTVDLVSRGNCHILPSLGDLYVERLTVDQLRLWLATLARTPVQMRSSRGRPNYKAAPVNDEQLRARKVSANRVLTMLKAALNFAYDDKLIDNRDAWGRRLKPFDNVAAARIRFLAVDEARRLINACDPEFRPLVQAALETGCRYSELTRLTVADFHIAQQRNGRKELIEVGTIAVRQSKTGKPRYVTLTPHGADFFRRHCLGRGGHELVFSHDGGRPWNRSEQGRPMQEACERARITPRVGFHGLRHTWASLAVMNGVPLLVVAKNLGHRDTRMVEHHYGHLAPSFIVDAIHAGAPVYGVNTDSTVVPLHQKAKAACAGSQCRTCRPRLPRRPLSAWWPVGWLP